MYCFLYEFMRVGPVLLVVVVVVVVLLLLPAAAAEIWAVLGGVRSSV